MPENDKLVPPDELVHKQEIGNGDFASVGEAIIAGLINRGYLNPSSRILDVGCGLGRLARPLTKYLNSSGEYHGFDVAKDSIDWCKLHYDDYKKFHFEWTNLYSKFYNPEGSTASSAYKFPQEDEFFDFIILTSVFSHLMIPAVNNYLSEISRVLKPGCRCYSTFFLITKEMHKVLQQRATRDGVNAEYTPIDGGYVQDKEVPEKVVFLREDVVLEIYSKYQLEVEAINYGTWCGRDVIGGYQDEVIAIKR